MHLACNYSAALTALLEKGAVEVQWIKTYDLDLLQSTPWQVNSQRGILIHKLPPLGASKEELQSFPWTKAAGDLEKARSPHTAAHLDFGPDSWPVAVERHYQSREVTRAMVERLVSNARWMAARLPVPLHVENAPYYGESVPRQGYSGAMRAGCQPEAIWEIVETSGASLLLDIAHARCTAYHLGLDARCYMNALPLSTVREIHVSGPRLIDGEGMRDHHYCMAEEDYRLLDWALARTQPDILTLEYGGVGDGFEIPERSDVAELEEQLVELSQR